MPPRTTHYEVLAVAPTATQDEIKRAWARQVREHPPEKDAAANQRVNEAKQTLVDPEARRQYDKMLLHGDAIGEALAREDAASEAEDHAAAAAALKEALALDPDDDAIRNRLALVTWRAGDHATALSIMRGLIRRAPTVALYRANLGRMLLDEEGPNKDAALAEATAQLREAVGLDPANADYHVALSQAYRRTKRFAEAENEIEAALYTDGKLDIQDIDTLFELPLLHLFSGELKKIKADAQRILDVVADLGEEARSYCAHRFARFASQLIDVDAHEAALRFADAAVTCDPNDKAVKDLRKTAKRCVDLETELSPLMEDGSVAHPIRTALVARSLLYLGQLDKDTAEEHYGAALRAMAEMTVSAVAMGLQEAKRRYPATYKLGREVYDKWLSDAQAACTRRASPQPSVSTPPASDGCLVPMCIALVGVAALIGSAIHLVGGL